MALFNSNTRIAVVTIEGVISDGGSFSTSRQRIVDCLKEAERKRAQGVVLRINSPGGTVGACQEVYAAVSRLAEKTPVVASMGEIAASGGVYIAMAANSVVANPGTITGSIGVIIRANDFSALYDQFGIVPKVIKSGEHKDMLASYRAFSPEERSLLQGLIDDSHHQFVEAVAAARKKPAREIEEIADGRILTGRQAHQFGLVDVLGDLQTAIDIVATRAGIKGKPKVLDIEPRRSFIARLLSPFLSRASYGAYLPIYSSGPAFHPGFHPAFHPAMRAVVPGWTGGAHAGIQADCPAAGQWPPTPGLPSLPMWVLPNI
ncbi:MAG TPA: signal peptide peptidase SppA [Blastocatellia bacterium]|nr:signal peptide peptidase SppA [Blastocatellia bacterium]